MRKEKEIYDLKHELISEQIKAETNEKAAKELEEKNKELRLENARLESDIEDLLSDDGSDKEALQTAEASITGDK